MLYISDDTEEAEDFSRAKGSAKYAMEGGGTDVLSDHSQAPPPMPEEATPLSQRELEVLRQPGRWIAEAPGNDPVRGYHLSRLYSPLANLRQMVYESEATSPSEIQEFQNSVLGKTFVPPGGSLSLDLLDGCHRDYDMPEGSQEMTYMGVDVGTKLHVVVRRRLGETGDASRALFIGELTDFTELATLGQRDGLPPSSPATIGT